MVFSILNPHQYKVMKNTLIITTDNDDLVSSVDDGTNTLFINDTEIPSNQWVGSGNYTTTVEGHNVTIAKIASLTGNVMIEKVSNFSYKLVSVIKMIPIYQDEEGNVYIEGNLPQIMLISDSDGKSFLKAYDAGAYGNNLLLQAGGNLLMGAGEYAQNRYNVDIAGSTGESTYVGADGAVYIETNAGTIGNRKTWFFKANGDLVTPEGGLINGVDLSKINTGDLTPSYKAGDSVSVNGIKVIGDVTNSKKALDFFIPLPKSTIERTVKLTLPASNGLSVRLGSGGYLNGAQYLDVTGSTFTITCIPRFNGVSVRIANTNEFNITNNNTAVSVSLNGTLSFS